MTIVLEHTQGPHKGLKQICGYLADGERPPEFLSPEGCTIEMLGRRIEGASLIAIYGHGRWALYREVCPKPTGKFGQTMETWHPDQT